MFRLSPASTTRVLAAVILAIAACSRDAMQATDPSDGTVVASAAAAATSISPTLLPVPSGNYDSGCARVAAGDAWIAGVMNSIQHQGLRPVMWRNGVFEELPLANTNIADVNRSGTLLLDSVNLPFNERTPGIWSHASGELTIRPPSGVHDAVPTAINNHGDIVAVLVMSPREPDEPWLRGGVWSPGMWWRILSYPYNPLSGSGAARETLAINDLAWVAGQCDDGHAYLWKSLEPTLIPVPDRFSFTGAVDLNGTGAVAGYVTLRSDALFRPAYWSPESGWIVIPIPEPFFTAPPGPCIKGLSDRS